MSIDLQALGFTKEELQDRAVERIVEMVMTDRVYDPDRDYEVERHSQFREDLKKRVKQRIDQKIDELAQCFVLPNVAEYIENLTLQQTNQWGEKEGEPITFIEYLVKRAQAYMQEEVNHDGKAKAECDHYSWHGAKQTRITFLIERHLHHSIETAMKDSLKVATGEIARGLHETTRIKLNEIAASMKVAVATK
ncbi:MULTISPECIES: hypothetical protein [unclassified Cupriavidus]|uniref:hypothetical protein n=1 Tax=unclassified Cupriavidus TaxID=2640874 RepID=UPI00313BDA1D